MIHLTNIAVQHGSQILFKDASFQLHPGSRTGLVGVNGSGKTTVFRLLAGEQQPDAGEISRPARLRIGYFSQSVGDMSGRSALEEVKAASADILALGEEIRRLEEEMSAPESDDRLEKTLARYGDAVGEFEHRGGYELEARAEAVLTGLGIAPSEHGNPVESFSGGWKMRIALARILTINPDVLLLDEPTNHLDVESIVWLETWLHDSFKGALLLTIDDREFMNRTVSRIVEIASRTITTYGGDYDFYLREKEVRREQLLASHRRQQEMLAKEEQFIARFAARASHASQVQSRVKKIDKIERIEIPAEEKVIRFEFNAPPRSGDEVAKFDALAKSWPQPGGGGRTVFSGVSGLIRRGDKIAVVGVNGAGKSTFLKILAGQAEQTAGALAIGANVRVGYFSQHAMEVLEPRRTVFETVREVLPLASIGVIRSLCGAFLFQGEAADKRVEALSGGEKSRVVLATLLAQPVNLLVLDEPTNHLDIQSREILLGALSRFDGTVVLVSHDRHFLRSLVDRVFEIDRGALRAFEGDYDYYLGKSRSDAVARPGLAMP
ncbi:MAG: ATP-binding cassette domain-containing protein [Proteobacteria bacterium]|jgi:ATP-binding cassette subfamily F protein 3|nr:ATP-binding cassette domain-containing protein [Pseudomonadota bacterium]